MPEHAGLLSGLFLRIICTIGLYRLFFNLRLWSSSYFLADLDNRRLQRLLYLFFSLLLAVGGVGFESFPCCSNLKGNGDNGVSKAKPSTGEQSTGDLPCIAGVKHPKENGLGLPEFQMLFSNVKSCSFIIDFLSFSSLKSESKGETFFCSPAICCEYSCAIQGERSFSHGDGVGSNNGWGSPPFGIGVGLRFRKNCVHLFCLIFLESRGVLSVSWFIESCHVILTGLLILLSASSRAKEGPPITVSSSTKGLQNEFSFSEVVTFSTSSLKQASKFGNGSRRWKNPCNIW